jgi:hypothetical protein
MGSSASAAIVMATWSGHALRLGYDTTGFFGHADIHLQDDTTAFTATFVYDTKKGDPTGVTAIHDRRHGGTATGFASPIVSSSFTINGTTTPITFFGDDLAEADVSGQHYFNDSDSFTTPTESLIGTLYVFGDGAPEARLTSAFSGPVENGYGNTYIHHRNTVTGAFIDEAAFTLIPTSLTVSVIKADVPEPSTWALTVLGFGLTGAELRRRNSRVAN